MYLSSLHRFFYLEWVLRSFNLNFCVCNLLRMFNLYRTIIHLSFLKTLSRARHSNVVIYRCEFCQKGFYRILAYEKHRATHTGVAAAVRCTQGDCDFTYSDMTQLKVFVFIETDKL